MTRLRLPVLLGLAALLCAMMPNIFADAPIVLRASAQQPLQTESAPQRIITLLPSLTETVCALGECARLVATDRYSNWPVSVQSLPKTGGLDDAQIELIVSLKPDVVILAQAPRVTDRLHELGVRTLDVESSTYADISRTVTTVGRLLDVPEKAVAVNRYIESSVNEAADAARVRLHGRSPRVYFEVDSGPYGAGPSSFIGELLARLGARNILTSRLGLFPKLNPEYVARQNPDVIFVSPKEALSLAHRPGWDQIRAVKEGRVCSFAAEVRDTIVRPGPRVAEGLRAMGDCLNRMAP
jgi:iron complex transport system substrate-binding protein